MGSIFGNCDLKFKWLNEPKLLLKVPLEKMSHSSNENSGLNFLLEQSIKDPVESACENSETKILRENRTEVSVIVVNRNSSGDSRIDMSS